MGLGKGRQSASRLLKHLLLALLSIDLLFQLLLSGFKLSDALAVRLILPNQILKLAPLVTKLSV